ncbi:MAG: NADH-quinone oxidoreductase subunit NuoE [Candidatus Riflebacteria bacterium]|nr:NADH-quinone oxidoreductase subunit NuoE [Candidatus Riflebacteria bacterium]
MKSKTVFSEKLRADILQLKAMYPIAQSALIPALHRVQEEKGHLEPNSMLEVAQLLGIPPIEVMKTGTFYTMFHHKPVGKYRVQVCVNLTCSMLGGRHLLSHLEEKLGIKDGETTSDGLFTLIGVQCLGACHEAPVVQINNDYHSLVSEKKLDTLLSSLRSGAKR